jgi:hypothetical protein
VPAFHHSITHFQYFVLSLIAEEIHGPGRLDHSWPIWARCAWPIVIVSLLRAVE